LTIKRLSLTELKLNITVAGLNRVALKKEIEAYNLADKWSQTSWARKTAKIQKRRQLTDFDRFKVMTLRKKVFS
jgi:large subunit ribosomal protein L14e